jgi:hypothetical protein
MIPSFPAVQQCGNGGKGQQVSGKKKQGQMTLLLKHLPLDKVAEVSASSTR